jgi:hypothetical protein
MSAAGTTTTTTTNPSFFLYLKPRREKKDRFHPHSSARPIVCKRQVKCARPLQS